MDFDTQMDEILEELGSAYNNDYPDRKAHKKAKAAIKQLIESKQPDEEQPDYEMKVASNNMTMGYNAAISAWREGMGL